MKKAIITLALTAFITGTLLIIDQTPTTNAGNELDKVAQAKHELYQTMADSIQQFNKESAEKISKYEMNIVEIQTRIANEKRNTNARYAKKLAELDQ